MSNKKRHEEKKGVWILFLVLIFCGLVIAVCSPVLMPILTDCILETVVTNMMVLSRTSKVFPDWSEPPVPLYSSYFIFNVENPDEILMGGKPVVTEKGPYVYRIDVPRENITFHGNGTVSSVQMYKYVYERSLSVGPESDTFTMVNPVAVSVTVLAKDFSKPIKNQLSEQMDHLNETIFMNRSVAEILWGYEDGFIGLVDKYFHIPVWDTDQFGILWGRNNSDLGVYTVFDGTEDQSMLNMFHRFKGSSELDWWYSPQANMLNGTDGSMYHPYVSRKEKLELFHPDICRRKEKLELFHPDICRSIPYHFEKDIELEGVPLLKFVLAQYAYANGTVHPPNAGFSKKDMWAPSGLLRQDPCRFGQPIALSNPHFLDGDQLLVDAIHGLSPDKQKHESYLAIEEQMGLPYIFKLRLQISSLMEPVEDIRQVENVRQMYFPLVWFEQSVEADEDIISLYKRGFVTSEKIMVAFQWFFFAFGIILASLSSLCFFRWYRLRDQTKNAKQDVEGNEASDTTSTEVFKSTPTKTGKKNLGFEEDNIELDQKM